MLKVIKYLIVIGLVSLPYYSGICQQPAAPPQAPADIVLPSANAEALGKFGVIPVNQFHGLPSIEVPLFQLDAKGFTLPVSLAYHASGIKVNELGSSAGIGWAINAGGIISRTVINKKDEGVNGFLANCNEVSSMPELLGGTTYNETPISYHSYASQKDAQPDQFNFNFAGLSGSFVLDCNGNPVLNLYSLIKVQILARSTEDILSWKVTDESGNVFYFDQVERSSSLAFNHYSICASTSIPSSTEPLRSAVTSWYLSRIETALGDVITFQYEDYLLKYNQFTSEVNWYYTSTCDFTACPGYDILNHCGGNAVYTDYVVESKRLTNISVASTNQSIEFSKGSIRYDLPYNTGTGPYGDYTLGSVKLKNASGIVVQSYNMTYGYLSDQASLITNATQHNFNYRLMLMSVTKTDGILSSAPYVFSYYEGIGFPRRSTIHAANADDPKRLDFMAIDELGYFNGKRTNNSLIADKWSKPFSTCNSCDSKSVSDRTPVFSNAVIGTIKTIKYPTGGTSTFEYEFSGTSALAIRSLRIKNIINNDGNGIVETTVYSYPKEEEVFTSGEQNISSRAWKQILGSVCYDFSYKYRFSMPRFSLNPSSVSMVVYPVVEKRKVYKDGAGEIDNGKEVFQYSFSDDDRTNGWPKMHIIDNSWKRGWLQSIKYYNRGNQSSFIREEQFIYENSDDNSALGAIVSGKNVGGALVTELAPKLNGCNTNLPEVIATKISFAKYYHRSHYYRLSQKKIIDYVPQGALAQTIDYSHSPVHLQVVKQTTKKSDGRDETQLYKYPLDYPYPPTPVGSQSISIKALVDRNMISTPIETYSTIGGKVASATIAEYKNTLNRIVPSKTLKFMPSSPVTDFTASGISGGQFTRDSRYKDELLFDQNNSYGQVLQYHKSDNSLNAIVYQKNGSVAARAVNAAYNSILFDSFEDNGSWSPGTGNISYQTAEKKTGKRSLQIATNSITGKASISIGILNSAGLLIGRKYKVEALVKGTNFNFRIRQNCSATTFVDYASPTTSAPEWQWVSWEFTFTSACQAYTALYLECNASPGANMFVFVDELRVYPAEAQMTSYTNDEFFGITSQTDSNCTTRYFEYDGLGRLIAIKDDKGNAVEVFSYHYKP